MEETKAPCGGLRGSSRPRPPLRFLLNKEENEEEDEGTTESHSNRARPIRIIIDSILDTPRGGGVHADPW